MEAISGSPSLLSFPLTFLLGVLILESLICVPVSCLLFLGAFSGGIKPLMLGECSVRKLIDLSSNRKYFIYLLMGSTFCGLLHRLVFSWGGLEIKLLLEGLLIFPGLKQFENKDVVGY